MVIIVTDSLFEDTEDIIDISIKYYRYHGN
jgi:hypothetical protein